MGRLCVVGSVQMFGASSSGSAGGTLNARAPVDGSDRSSRFRVSGHLADV